MNKVHINYDLLLTAAEGLEQVKDATTKKAVGNIENSINDILSLGNKHDNCFSSISAETLTEEITNISEELSELSQKCYTTVEVYSKAESFLDNTLFISSVGLNNALKYQLKQKTEITANYDIKYYQKLLDSLLDKGNTTREKTTVAALFLATSFPHLPYFWGGGHEKITEGLDSTWGSKKLVTAEGSATSGTYQPNSLDCSGYVSWALKNGGFKIDKPMVTGELEKLGTVKELAGIDPTTVKNGDFGYMDEHIGVVVDVEANKITVAHCAGSGTGMNMTTMDATTGKVLDDARNPSKVGESYFTQIISVDYPDEIK